VLRLWRVQQGGIAKQRADAAGIKKLETNDEKKRRGEEGKVKKGLTGFGSQSSDRV
jgi:hypothetical protein